MNKLPKRRKAVRAWALFTPKGKMIETGINRIPWIAKKKEAFYPYESMARKIEITKV